MGISGLHLVNLVSQRESQGITLGSCLLVPSYHPGLSNSFHPTNTALHDSLITSPVLGGSPAKCPPGSNPLAETLHVNLLKTLLRFVTSLPGSFSGTLAIEFQNPCLEFESPNTMAPISLPSPVFHGSSASLLKPIWKTF